MAVSGKDLKLPLEIEQIKECIPHRYPFLLIDRIIQVNLLKDITAVRNVSYSDPILQGHFPGNPVLPGVLIVEGMAQTAAVLGHLSQDHGLETCLLTEVSESRFRKPIVPGESVHYHVKLVRSRKPFFWFEGVATVADAEVARVKFSALMR